MPHDIIQVNEDDRSRNDCYKKIWQIFEIDSYLINKITIHIQYRSVIIINLCNSSTAQICF